MSQHRHHEQMLPCGDKQTVSSLFLGSDTHNHTEGEAVKQCASKVYGGGGSGGGS